MISRVSDPESDRIRLALVRVNAAIWWEVSRLE